MASTLSLRITHRHLLGLGLADHAHLAGAAVDEHLGARGEPRVASSTPTTVGTLCSRARIARCDRGLPV